MTVCLSEIGSRISERRKSLGFTQEKLAELANVTTQCISLAEAGKRGLRPENLMGVASALGVSADYLLTGDIIDKDLLLISKKIQKLTPDQINFIEVMVDEIDARFNKTE